MAGNYRFAMDQKDIVRVLVTTVDSFIRDRLINKEQRIQHKEQCAERLAAEDGSCDKDSVVRYSDQAVLANLDWGIEALEEAIDTSNMETKLARLDYAEKMLQVCALLNSNEKTAGVPNFYLSAWAHLNLSYLWKLRGNVHNSVVHVLDMFIIDPFFSRIDFAPELWKELFLPHMNSIVGWYSQERHRLVMEVIPDSTDLSFTADFDQFFNESLVFSMRPDQVEKLQKLEQLYGESLDENTRLYAKYFKDCLNSDSSSSKKIVPMFPIAEPPMTPLHEVSRSIPDYVKFGPILPKSAGFSPVLKSKDGAQEPNRMKSKLDPPQNLEKISKWDSKESLLEKHEEDLDYLTNDSYGDLSPSSTRTEEEETGSNVEKSKLKNHIYSPTIFSPRDSPLTPSPNNLSHETDAASKKEAASALRLLSSRITDLNISTSIPGTPLKRSDCSSSPAYSDNEELKKFHRRSYNRTQSLSNDIENRQLLENSSGHEFEEGSQSNMTQSLSENLIHSSRPTKDFVCPITGQIFSDPVSLETGQTYERKAIHEWLKRGNTTCPITRQPLSSNTLPKTNYVLKRLITSWKEQLPDIPQDCSYSGTPIDSYDSPFTKDSPTICNPHISPSFHHNNTSEHLKQIRKRFIRAVVATSPTSVISQAAVETIINGLKPFVSCLCDSRNLQECESAVLAISRLWKDSKADPAVQLYLSDPTIVNGFVEILSASMDREVLRTTIYILSELVFADENVVEPLTRVDSDFDCLAALLKNGLSEAAVLICQMKPSFAQLSAHDLIPSLVQIILNKNEDSDDLQFVMEPKDAAISMLEQILMRGDENSRSLNALGVISANGIPPLLKCLNVVEVRTSIVSILSCCMKAEKSCRNLIANRIELTPILELFHAGNDCERGICVSFLSELVQLNRRTLCNHIMQIIKDEGVFSTMHTLLVYLQMAPMEKQPAIASLLLQLDLLNEPRKMSIYREEAIDALIEYLRRRDLSSSQTIALDAILSLTGRLTSSGKSYTEAWLLKIAGFDQPYNALMKAEQLRKLDDDLVETMEEEEKAISAWEKRVASVLCNHEKGSIFKALQECLKCNSIERARSCLVILTWLCHMLSILPDTGVRDTARKSLLDAFVNVLQSSCNLEEKILAALGLKAYISDPAALEQMGENAKCIYISLRKLKRHSTVVAEIMKSLMNLSTINATNLWNYTEVAELDSCPNGEVLSLIYLKGRILSSHSDGTIKVWDAGKKVARFEVHKHIKAVTCLCVSSSGDTLYSGSLDKTIRVWLVKPEEIQCIQVHDVKEPVYELMANVNIACFVSQGTGVRVYNWSGVPKHINFNKYVKCLALSEDKLYCGCSGDSIQEVDLSKYTSNTFYVGIRKLLCKQTIYAIHIHDNFLFAGGSSVDGTASKIFSLSTKAMIGSLSTGSDIHRVAINSDFIFTATKCGIIEVWLKEKFTKIASFRMGCGGNAKITSLITDVDGGILFAGSSDGKIQVWSLD